MITSTLTDRIQAEEKQLAQRQAELSRQRADYEGKLRELRTAILDLARSIRNRHELDDARRSPNTERAQLIQIAMEWIGVKDGGPPAKLQGIAMGVAIQDVLNRAAVVGAAHLDQEIEHQAVAVGSIAAKHRLGTTEIEIAHRKLVESHVGHIAGVDEILAVVGPHLPKS